MFPLVRGTVGILPAGALGVAFFYHLTAGLTPAALAARRVRFLPRPGSTSTGALRAGGVLHVAGPGNARHAVPLGDALLDHPLVGPDRGELPEVLLVCPNPDALLGVVSALAVLPALPIVVLSANGIYFERVRQMFAEKLEEAALFGRSPRHGPDGVGRLLRGVTLQTGTREGVGAGAVYRPGPRGCTRLAGGDPPARAHAVELLSGLGGWFEAVADLSPTRLEFDKALLNLSTNVLGVFLAVDVNTGAVRALNVGEMVAPAQHGALRELAGHVLAVGRAVGAYGPKMTVEAATEYILATSHAHAAHVPSSLQRLTPGGARNQVPAGIPSTEAWLLEPLARYARSAGLDGSAGYFENLGTRLLATLRATARP